MDAAGCFVDVDVPARPAGVPDGDEEFTIPKAISSFSTGLTPEGYFFDEHGAKSCEKDFSFLQDVYGGECILLKESETLKGGVDDMCLVLRIRIKLLLEYQLVKVQSIPTCEGATIWNDHQYHANDEQDFERYAFVQLTAEAAEKRMLLWKRKLTRASRQKKGSLGKRKRGEEDEEDEDESEDEEGGKAKE
jgi:hypothetical protein